ncbi:MAG: dynamin family protein [Microcoleaceae cyanobacterium]
MDVSKIQTETVNLLSDITGLKISQKDINPTILFLSALVSVLLGVIFVDQQVTEEEIQRLKITLRQFIPKKGNMAQLVKLMVKGIRQKKVYQNINHLLLLTAPFSESENLLLISLGYEMSAADGSMDTREKQYLEIIAQHLKIETKHLNTLESAFGGAVSITQEDIEKVRFLLDPVWFHDLDSVFVKAASQILKIFPENTEKKQNQQQVNIRYKGLQAFQEYKTQLDKKCFDLNQIVQECINKEFLQESLIQEIYKVSKKLQSQKFRVAVVGEFSQGKSTILNALLGENIQPVRDIPCSGAVTVLRYGSQKRVICCYKDQRQEEISLNQYHEKAAISEAAALGSRTEELKNSEIREIIFEHPNLALCQYGVEIIDSPGLNEHPARTEITQTLLKDTDAVIFVANASRLLTQGERELLQDLKNQLNGGKEDKPANNLFMLVNFWDMIRSETSRQQVKKRVENLVIEQNKIIAGSNRIHYISAQQTLDAVLRHSAHAQSKGTENEYVQSFSQFTQSLEHFLTQERGILEVQKASQDIHKLVKSAQVDLCVTEDILGGKLKVSEEECQKIIEKIGEASGRDIKIKQFAEELFKEVADEFDESWNTWLEYLDERLPILAENWSSEYSAFFSRDQLIQDYINQFQENIADELNGWIENELKAKILTKYGNKLDKKIQEELFCLEQDLHETIISIYQVSADSQKSSNYKFDMNSKVNYEFNWLGLGTAALVPLILLSNPIAMIAGFVASLVGGWNIGSAMAVDDEIKGKVFEAGCEQFCNSVDNIIDAIAEIIIATFDEREEQAEAAIKEIIMHYDNILKQNEKAHQESLEQRKQDQDWIEQQRQKIGQFKHEIEEIVEKVKVS